LDCGADLEACDSNGETPLRRAVNCGQSEVVSLLLCKGANPRSISRNGSTPMLAARTAAMKQILLRAVENRARG
jgi:ankyrin repeat protein